MQFKPFPKIPRFNRDIVITEKIDGTNAQILIDDASFDEEGTAVAVVDGLAIWAGSRKRWLDTTSSGDNFGFAKWVEENASELTKLGIGQHFGEWWGQGIQRGYGLEERKFSLFNTKRWSTESTSLPNCCSVVPTIFSGRAGDAPIADAIALLKQKGSLAAPGFMEPEGVVVYHTAGNNMYKVMCENDDTPKGE